MVGDPAAVVIDLNDQPVPVVGDSWRQLSASAWAATLFSASRAIRYAAISTAAASGAEGGPPTAGPG